MYAHRDTHTYTYMIHRCVHIPTHIHAYLD